MEIKFSKQAVKFIEKQDKNTKTRLKQAIDGLRKEPPEGDIKPLQGTNGIFRLRVGKYRVLYSYVEDVIYFIYIQTIDSRGDIYKKGGF